MEVSATGGFGIGGGSAAGGGSDAELQTLFLDLMIKQMQHQDPFNPMDNSQMVAQLATFTNLEQLQGINIRLDQSMAATEALSGVLTETANTTMMLTLPGREVTVPGNAVKVEDGDASRLLLRGTTRGSYRAVVKDADGEEVRSFSGTLSNGFTEVQWDGRNEDNEPVGDGEYTIEIEGFDVDGEPVPVAVFNTGIVETVQFDSNGTWVIVNGQKYSIGQIVEVGIGTGQMAIGGSGDDTGDGDDGGEEDTGGGDSGGGDPPVISLPWNPRRPFVGS